MCNKYLITGGAGFIGSHLCERLLDDGSQVIAMDNLSTGHIENIQHLHSNPNFQFVREDILNTQFLKGLGHAFSNGCHVLIPFPMITLNAHSGHTHGDSVLTLIRITKKPELESILRPQSMLFGEGGSKRNSRKRGTHIQWQSIY